MRARTVAAAAVLTISTLGVGGAPALAGGLGDRNCDDFSSREEAQEAYDAVPGDPDGLDSDDDGEACEATDYDDDGDAAAEGDDDGDDAGDGDADEEDSGDEDSDDNDESSDDDTSDDDQMVMPSGGVDTGAGSTAGVDNLTMLLGGGLLAAVGAGGVLVQNRRRSTD